MSEMFMTLVTRLSGVVIVSVAVGCRPSPTIDSGASAALKELEAMLDGSHSSATPIAVADTAFIEERRYEQRGVRTPNGGCMHPSGISLPAPTPGDTVRRVRSGRATLRDPSTCTFLVSEGYRKMIPPEHMTDMAGTAGVSATAVYPPPPK